ncbi:MAG: hypothetical protein II670_12290 [Alphaproteobacteria bacterium]|nr:hypothetical protein [Alphaproteobacteria bacterium]
MQIITSVTDQPKQQFNLKLDNNERATMRLYYYESQNSWYFDIEYNGRINNGNKVVLTFNALRHLKRLLPFGISFISESNADPFSLDAFTSGKVVMILLNQEDVNLIEETVYNESAK